MILPAGKSFEVMVILVLLTAPSAVADLSLPRDAVSTARGNTLKVWCDVTGLETFVGWYDPRQTKLSSNDTSERRHVESLGTRHFLVIQEIEPAIDGGIYECRGNISKVHLTINVDFTANPPQVQKLHLNKSGIIQLGAYGYPAPEFAWKKNDVPFDPTFNPRFTLLDDGSLQISRVETADEGKYDCHITQGIGLKDVSIRVSVVQTPQITVYQEFAREITEGQNTTFVCSATGIPGPTIKWVDQDGRMIDSLTDSRLSVFGGNLMVSGVIKSDAAKTYFCQASNSVGQDTVNATITKVWTPAKLKPVNDVKKQLGQKAVLECVTAAGDEPVNVVWRKDGAELPEQQKTPGKSTVVFEKVKIENSGRYICEATNGARDENGNKLVTRDEAFLFITAPPVLNKAKSETVLYSTIDNPSPVKITCNFFGNPIPVVTMTKNGLILAKNKTRVSYEIKDIKENNFGEFNCSAINIYGQDSHIVELRRAEPPRITVLPQATRELTAGYNTTFKCNATGIPTPTIKWVDQYSKFINHTSDKRFIISNGYLTITGVKPVDINTNFTCEATNEVGIVKGRSARISRVFVQPQLIPVSDIVKNFSEAVSLTCTASGGDPTPSVVWTKNGVVVKNQQQSANQSIMVFDKVEQSDAGKYVCKALNGARDKNNKLIVVKEEANLFVNPPRPGRPANLKVVSSCNSLTLQWSKPLNDGDVPVTEYQVQIDSHNGAFIYSGIVPSSVTSYQQKDNIKRNECFAVKVIARSAFGQSQPAERSVYSKRFCPPYPPHITSPTEKILRTTSFLLKWKKPANDGGDRNIRYRVIYTEMKNKKGASHGISITISGLQKTQFAVSRLTPGTRYRFQVYAVTRGGHSEPDQKQYLIAVNALGVSGGQRHTASLVPVTTAVVLATLIAIFKMF